MKTREEIFLDVSQKLNQIFKLQGCKLESIVSKNKHSKYGVWTEKDKRSCYVWYHKDSPEFTCEFYEEIFLLAKGTSSSLSDIASSICNWILNFLAPSELSQKFNYIETSEFAPYFEQGRETEWRWKDLLKEVQREASPLAKLKPILQLMSQISKINQFFPTTSHSNLYLSRCTRWPYYSEGLPSVSPMFYDSEGNFILESNKFKVFLDEKKLGEGDAQTAYELLLQAIPDDCEPAIIGTKDDLEKMKK